MNLTRATAVLAVLGLLTACGDGNNSSSGSSTDTQQEGTPDTLPAMETDRDPTPQTGTGGAGQSRPDGQTNP
ncbi:hypothetical protein SAMN05880561_101611 [Rhizobium sp. RU33A]|nr:hypothetical protein SAMN05880561_101611 [Rhizobium sp. RU33A]